MKKSVNELEKDEQKTDSSSNGQNVSLSSIEDLLSIFNKSSFEPHFSREDNTQKLPSKLHRHHPYVRGMCPSRSGAPQDLQYPTRSEILEFAHDLLLSGTEFHNSAIRFSDAMLASQIMDHGTTDVGQDYDPKFPCIEISEKRYMIYILALALIDFANQCQHIPCKNGCRPWWGGVSSVTYTEKRCEFCKKDCSRHSEKIEIFTLVRSVGYNME